MKPPTEKELNRFAMFLDVYERTGASPTIAEMKEMFGLSNGTVQTLRQTWLRKGLVKKVRSQYIPVPRGQFWEKLYHATFDIQRELSDYGFVRAQQKARHVMKRINRERKS